MHILQSLKWQSLPKKTYQWKAAIVSKPSVSCTPPFQISPKVCTSSSGSLSSHFLTPALSIYNAWPMKISFFSCAMLFKNSSKSSSNTNTKQELPLSNWRISTTKMTVFTKELYRVWEKRLGMAFTCCRKVKMLLMDWLVLYISMVCLSKELELLFCKCTIMHSTTDLEKLATCWWRPTCPR